MKKNIISAQSYRYLFYVFLILSLCLSLLLSIPLIFDFKIDLMIAAIVSVALTLLLSPVFYRMFFKWGFIVFPDRVIHTKVLGKRKEYLYSNYTIIGSDKYVGIYDGQFKIVARISFILDNYEYLEKCYKKWIIKNKITRECDIIKYNSYARGFGLFFIFIGLVIYLLFLIAFLIDPNEIINQSIQEDIFGYFFMLLGGLSIVVGMILMLWYMNWGVKIATGKFIYINWRRKKTIYELEDLKKDSTSKRIIVYHRNKKVGQFFIHLTDGYWILDEIEYIDFNEK